VTGTLLSAAGLRKASFSTRTDLLVDGGMFCLNKAFSYNP
jgi:hypothetical protein